MGKRGAGLSLATMAAAVVAPPAVARCEAAPTVEAINEPADGIYKERHSWSPTQVSVQRSSTQGRAGGSPSSPGSSSASTGPSASSPAEALFLSGPHALELLNRGHGSSVRGSVAVSRAAAQGRLEVSLYADGASLPRASGAGQVRVGRRLLAPVRAGEVSFAVTLSPRAWAALRRNGRLQLTLRLVLAPVHGAAQTLRRKLLLRT